MVSRTQLVRFAALAGVMLLAGCHKRVRVATPPLPLPSIPAKPMPTTIPGPPVDMPAATPATPPASEPVPTPAPAPTPRPAARRPAPAAKPAETAPAPTPPTPTPTPDLGNLSEGGASGNAGDQRAQAQALIAETDKRLQALPASTQQQKRQQLAQVQQFLRQAKEALNSGDPAGANNLAVKSKLLLDDLLK